MATAPRKASTTTRRTPMRRTAPATPAAPAKRTTSGAAPAAKETPAPAKAASSTPVKTTPTAESVSAAQELLASIERRESNLRAAMREHAKQLSQSKKTLKRHRSTAKSLKKDLKRVTVARVAVIKDL